MSTLEETLTRHVGPPLWDLKAGRFRCDCGTLLGDAPLGRSYNQNLFAEHLAYVTRQWLITEQVEVLAEAEWQWFWDHNIGEAAEDFPWAGVLEESKEGWRARARRMLAVIAGIAP